MLMAYGGAMDEIRATPIAEESPISRVTRHWWIRQPKALCE